MDASKRSLSVVYDGEFFDGMGHGFGIIYDPHYHYHGYLNKGFRYGKGLILLKGYSESQLMH